jgi:hypothetical protein
MSIETGRTGHRVKVDNGVSVPEVRLFLEGQNERARSQAWRVIETEADLASAAENVRHAAHRYGPDSDNVTHALANFRTLVQKQTRDAVLTAVKDWEF